MGVSLSVALSHSLRAHINPAQPVVVTAPVPDTHTVTVILRVFSMLYMILFKVILGVSTTTSVLPGIFLS